jgi:threonine synthase
VRDAARRLSLGEGDTPCIPLPRLAAELGLATLHAKDEGRQPAGSFKARGLAVALAAHAERGARSVTLPSAGNAAAAAAAYARVHGLACRVVLPTAATPTYRLEARLCGARVLAVSGDLGAAADWVRDHPGGEGDHVIATFREPFRLEGKKTMGLELWETFGEELPDAVIFPTGGGVGLVAIAKALDELREAGLLRAASPRLVAAQVDSCAPIVRAFEAGASAVDPWDATRRTLAEGLRVPRVGGGRLVLRALRETGGTAIAIEEPALIEAIRRAAGADGVLLSAEGGVALAALVALRARGDLEGARVVFFNTASPYKVPETLQAAGTG